jgi:hypothetical protein
MRKGLLGSIAALAAGAGVAWGQSPLPFSAGDPPPPAAVAPSGNGIPGQAQVGGPLGLIGPKSPAPVIMPPLAFGRPGDPQGLGPVAGSGPPPGPMYPNPGPYSAPLFQPGPPPPGNGGGYGGAPHWWTTMDYLLFFAKSQPSSFPLLTTSAPSDQGQIGRASTLVLAGGQDISYNPISGFRVGFGFFGDCDRRWGFEALGTVFESKGNVTSVASASSIPTLARPFIDSSNIRLLTSQVVANPNFGIGRVVVGTTNQTYWVEGNGIINLYRSEPGCKLACSLDFLAGYRYLEVKEDLTINSSTILNQPSTTNPVFALGPFGVVTQVGTTTTPASVPFGGVTINPPATVVVHDSFKVTNRFNGGQVGLRGETRYGMFTFTATGKFAFGDMNERLEIAGASGFADLTRPLPNGLPNTGNAFGGLFANASNIGRYNHDEFTVIPEINLNFGINVTRGLTAFLGYNFLYINNLARPVSQLNPVVNQATVPFSPLYGNNSLPTVPRQIFAQDEFWMMGINFGLMMRY